MFRINLKNDIHFLCAPEDSILIEAQKENITLNHHCKTGLYFQIKVKNYRSKAIKMGDLFRSKI